MSSKGGSNGAGAGAQGGGGGNSGQVGSSSGNTGGSMKAPGGGGATISREAFENNPQGYFSHLHAAQKDNKK